MLGWAEFLGHRIVVEPGVFVPRHRTEFLVARAVALAGAGPVLLDLCCGSGALGVAVASAVAVAQWHASDIDPVAVRCARRNVGHAGTVYHGDLFQPLPDRLRGSIDLLVANTPYVPTDEIALLPPEFRDYEHRVALDGGPDGLALARRVVAAAPEWLAPGGRLLIETSLAQASDLGAAARAAGLTATTAVDRDDDGEANATVMIATKPVRGVGEMPPAPAQLR